MIANAWVAAEEAVTPVTCVLYTLAPLVAMIIYVIIVVAIGRR